MSVITYHNLILDEIKIKHEGDKTFIFGRINYTANIITTFFGIRISTKEVKYIKSIYCNDNNVLEIGPFKRSWRYLDELEEMPDILNLKINLAYENQKAQQLLNKGDNS